MAAYIERSVNSAGGGKLVVIAGYAHAVMPDGLADRLESRLQRRALVAAVFKDADESARFHDFLWEQAKIIQVNLSRPPHFYYAISDGALHAENFRGRYAAIDGTHNREIPSICLQWAQLDPRGR